ncbi:MAG: hypothetical protein LBI47_02390, partial [Puniceicoccales bacterium]|nr:hypothetical protein [Puniceicoccales bacterium]
MQRASIALAILGCLAFDPPLVGEDVPITDEQISAQEWTAPGTVIFRDDGASKGALNVTSSAGGNIIAATVIGTGEVLTIEFENEPSVETAITDGESTVYAHIYAVNNVANQSAVGINLAEDVNLNIDRNTGHTPVLVAHSAVTGTGGNSSAIAVQTLNTNSVGISNPAYLTAFASSNKCSASAVIEAAPTNNTSSTNILNVQFDDNNILRSSSSVSSSSVSSSSSYLYSASVVMGSAVGYGTDSMNVSGLEATLGNHNTLTSLSSSDSAKTIVKQASPSVSTVVGAAVGHGTGDVNVSNLSAQLKDNNNLTSLSSSDSSSSSAVVGTAVVYG